MLLLARLGAPLLVRDEEANPLEEGVEDGLPLGAGSPPPPILGHIYFTSWLDLPYSRNPLLPRIGFCSVHSRQSVFSTIQFSTNSSYVPGTEQGVQRNPNNHRMKGGGGACRWYGGVAVFEVGLELASRSQVWGPEK